MRIFLIAMLFATHAVAQTYPSKPVRMVVGFAPGFSAARFARAFQAPLSRARPRS